MADKSSPLYIGNEMAAYDRKDRDYYDKFTVEEKKQFSTYLMLRYGASVGGNKDLQAYYLMATNKLRKVVAELYPNMKSDEMDMFLEMNTEKEIKEYCKELGWDDKRIKSEF